MSGKQKVLIIGPCPPPYGGVSVHIFRLYNLLKNDFEFDFIDESAVQKKEFFNIRSLQLLVYIKKMYQCDTLFIHSGKDTLRIFHLIIGRLLAKKIILVLHGFTSSPPKFIFLIKSFIYRIASTVIVVNNEIKLRLRLSKKKCIIKDAFIPPNLNEEPELPNDIHNLLSEKRKEKKVILCSNASSLEKYSNQDLYGLDLCIEVCRRLYIKKVKFFFVFIVSSIRNNEELYTRSIELIKKYGLTDNFLLIHQKLSFIKVMEYSDIIVRATNTDGDSLTVREGLFLRKKVIASDIVKRPAGVVLFQNRNMNDLEVKLLRLISTDSELKLLNQGGINDTINSLKKFYGELIRNPCSIR